MSYDFSAAASAQAIAEQEYATATTVSFTRFMSCIGVLARSGNDVTGVHLVIMSNTDSPFDNAAADAVVQLLGNYASVVVIGQIELWEDSLPGPFQHLLQGLQQPRLISVNDGIYGGRVDNNRFQICRNGNWANV